MPKWQENEKGAKVKAPVTAWKVLDYGGFVASKMAHFDPLFSDFFPFPLCALLLKKNVTKLLDLQISRQENSNKRELELRSKQV